MKFQRERLSEIKFSGRNLLASSEVPDNCADASARPARTGGTFPAHDSFGCCRARRRHFKPVSAKLPRRATERLMMEDTAGRIMVRAAMKAPYLEREEEHR